MDAPDQSRWLRSLGWSSELLKDNRFLAGVAAIFLPPTIHNGYIYAQQGSTFAKHNPSLPSYLRFAAGFAKTSIVALPVACFASRVMVSWLDDATRGKALPNSNVTTVKQFNFGDWPDLVREQRFQVVAALSFFGVTLTSGFLNASTFRENIYDIDTKTQQLRVIKGPFAYGAFFRGFMYSSMVAAPLAMLVGRTFVNDSNEVEADEKYSGDTVIARSIAASVETGLKYGAIAGIPLGVFTQMMQDGVRGGAKVLGFLGVMALTCAASMPISFVVGLGLGYKRQSEEQGAQKR